MNLAIIITHNKTDADNIAQIETLKPLIEKQTILNDEFDEQGNVVGQFETYYYTIKGLIGHEAKFYQIIPFGVTPPPNLYDIDSHKVFYGDGDEDKTDDHPRFFNWGLKRGTDNGAEIVVHIEDITKFSVEDLAIQVNTLIDPTDKTEYTEDLSVKVASLTLLKEVGQLDETKTKQEAIEELKGKLEVTIG